MRGLAKEQEQERDGVVERGGARSALTVCLYLLAAVNLVVMLVVTQLPIVSSDLEPVVWQGGAPRPQYLVEASQSMYRFQSCTGGGSVNCHRTGNAAGL